MLGLVGGEKGRRERWLPSSPCFLTSVLCTYLSITLIYLSACPSIDLSIHPHIYPSILQSIHPSVHPSIHPSVFIYTYI